MVNVRDPYGLGYRKLRMAANGRRFYCHQLRLLAEGV